MANTLKVEAHLKGFTLATTSIPKQLGVYHLIILELKGPKPVVIIESFSKKRLNEASDRYAQIEKEIFSGESKQAVLVSAGKIKDLKKAYPNYFLDTKEFISKIKTIRKQLANL